MSYTQIARLIPTIQASALVGKNLEIATKKKKKTKDMVNLGVTNLVGLSLIKVNADMIAGL